MRDKASDIASGFCLLIVIIGHIICWCPTDVRLYAIVDVFCFYLSFFFFRSGMMYREKTFRESIVNTFKKILVPYLVFNLLGLSQLLINIFFKGQLLFGSTLKTDLLSLIQNGAFMSNLPLWFLLSLAFARLLFNELHKVKYALISFSVLCVVYLIILSIYKVAIPLYFKNVPLAFLMIYSGYLAKNLISNKMLVCLCIIIYLGLLFFFPSHLSFMGGGAKSGLIGTGFIADIAGNILIYNFAKLMCFNKRENILANFGKNTMPYYCMHWIVIAITISFMNYFAIDNGYYRIFFCCASCLIVLPIMSFILNSNLFSWMLGVNKHAKK